MSSENVKTIRMHFEGRVKSNFRKLLEVSALFYLLIPVFTRLLLTKPLNLKNTIALLWRQDGGEFAENPERAHAPLAC